MIFTINECSVDTAAYEVRRNGSLVPIEPQVFDLLVQLLENRDRVVTKDEIIERIWNGRVVSEAALSSRIKAVRQAIGDDGASQACIRTIRRRGFRVVADVTESAGPGGSASTSSQVATADIQSDGSGSGRPPNLDRHRVETIEDLGEDHAATASNESARGWITTFTRPRTAALVVIAMVALGSVAGWHFLRRDHLSPVPISPAALGMPAGPGIAVLRFNNPSGDSTLGFLEGALTEEIVTQLTRFSELRVAGRALTAEYDHKEMDIKDVGQKFGAEFLVQGSLRRSGDRVRLTAQLIKALDGTLLWAESYERHLTPADIFAVQEDIASKVVAAIASISAGVIARQTLDQARGKPPRDLSAYECTIRANEIMVFSAASHLATRTCLEAAIESEPDYAAAWAMLAWIHTFEFTQDLNKRPGSDPRERALAAARRAIDLAPANPMARFAMARAAYLKGDLDVFYAEAAHALRLNPHEPFLLGNLGNWLAFSGRWDEGVAMIQKAIALNPKVYPRWWHAALGKHRYSKGEYREALVEFKNMNLPNWWWNQVELAYTYGQLGDMENARTATAKLLELYPGFDLRKAAVEHKKFSFEQSYIDLAVDGLRKAGVPAKSPDPEKP